MPFKVCVTFELSWKMRTQSDAVICMKLREFFHDEWMKTFHTDMCDWVLPQARTVTKLLAISMRGLHAVAVAPLPLC